MSKNRLFTSSQENEYFNSSESEETVGTVFQKSKENANNQALTSKNAYSNRQLQSISRPDTEVENGWKQHTDRNEKSNCVSRDIQWSVSDSDSMDEMDFRSNASLSIKLPYTRQEDELITKFVLRGQNIFRASSVSLWKHLESKKENPKRTYQSLKNRFLRSIKPKLFTTYKYLIKDEETVNNILIKFPELKRKRKEKNVFSSLNLPKRTETVDNSEDLNTNATNRIRIPSPPLFIHNPSIHKERTDNIQSNKTYTKQQKTTGSVNYITYSRKVEIKNNSLLVTAKYIRDLWEDTSSTTPVGIYEKFSILKNQNDLVPCPTCSKLVPALNRKEKSSGEGDSDSDDFIPDSIDPSKEPNSKNRLVNNQVEKSSRPTELRGTTEENSNAQSVPKGVVAEDCSTSERREVNSRTKEPNSKNRLVNNQAEKFSCPTELRGTTEENSNAQSVPKEVVAEDCSTSERREVNSRSKEPNSKNRLVNNQAEKFSCPTELRGTTEENSNAQSVPKGVVAEDCSTSERREVNSSSKEPNSKNRLVNNQAEKFSCPTELRGTTEENSNAQSISKQVVAEDCSTSERREVNSTSPNLNKIIRINSRKSSKNSEKQLDSDATNPPFRNLRSLSSKKLINTREDSDNVNNNSVAKQSRESHHTSKTAMTTADHSSTPSKRPYLARKAKAEIKHNEVVEMPKKNPKVKKLPSEITTLTHKERFMLNKVLKRTYRIYTKNLQIKKKSSKVKKRRVNNKIVLISESESDSFIDKDLCLLYKETVSKCRKLVNSDDEEEEREVERSVHNHVVDNGREKFAPDIESVDEETLKSFFVDLDSEFEYSNLRLESIIFDSNRPATHSLTDNMLSK